MSTENSRWARVRLAAGDYKVTTDGSQAKFQKGSKVVAEVPCTVKPLSFMPHETVFVVDHDSISEIQVSGNIKAIEFASGAFGGN